jgi:DNA-binding CsgD family transcriptional regulator
MKLCADRILALLAQTAGSIDTASIHFDKSVNFCQESGYLPELAWTCHDYANMLVQSDNAGDKHKAAALIKDALEITARLGMTPLQEKLVDLHGSITAPSERLTGYPDGLTEREIEVLRLVALGKSNREVASELYISINTVLRHMTHIFSKTGTNNRTEAATYAVQKGIT